MVLDDFFLKLKSIAWEMVRELCDTTESRSLLLDPFISNTETKCLRFVCTEPCRQ